MLLGSEEPEFTAGVLLPVSYQTSSILAGTCFGRVPGIMHFTHRSKDVSNGLDLLAGRLRAWLLWA